MKSKTALKIAGGLSVFFFIFHLPFYWMLDWEHTLACLSRDNWAIFHCFNVLLTALFLLMAVVSLFCTEELATTRLGKMFLAYCSFLFTFRIVAEFIFFNFPNAVFSSVIIVMCAVPAILFAIPVFRKTY